MSTNKIWIIFGCGTKKGKFVLLGAHTREDNIKMDVNKEVESVGPGFIHIRIGKSTRLL